MQEHAYWYPLHSQCPSYTQSESGLEDWRMGRRVARTGTAVLAEGRGLPRTGTAVRAEGPGLPRTGTAVRAVCDGLGLESDARVED